MKPRLARRSCRIAVVVGVGALLTTTLAPTASALPRDTSSRPAGPAADLSQRLTGGDGVFIGSATHDVNLKKAGWIVDERAAAGTATSYTAGGPLPADGRWNLTESTKAPYKTRVLIRRPKRASDFNGTVVVEWLNVSGGVDADPDWASLSAELVRRGYAYVGVSAQQIGVNGGPVLVSVPGVGAGIVGKGLKAIDPVRYGSLVHPGDGYSFDIYTQVARALRKPGALGRLRVHRVLAAGESQSAFALVTYVDGVQPKTKEFDGFLIHSRGASPLPIVGPGKSADIAGSIAGTPTIIRTDNRAPVIELQSESDIAGILNSGLARQPDSRWLRLWETVGTAHADRHLMGSTADALDCGAPVNDGPMHVIAKAGLRHLDAWVRGGSAPPKAPRVTLDARHAIVRDRDGIARGGVRTAPVEAPVVVLSAVPGPNASVICLLLGSTKPLPAAAIAARYPSRKAYVHDYTKAVDRDIKAGFVLRDDRKALLAYAHPQLVNG